MQKGKTGNAPATTIVSIPAQLTEDEQETEVPVPGCAWENRCASAVDSHQTLCCHSEPGAADQNLLLSPGWLPYKPPIRCLSVALHEE